MAKPFTYWSVAIATLATVYSAVAVPANARADDFRAPVYPPTELGELLQWHSGVSVVREYCRNPEWKSALIAIDPEESMASRVWRGAGTVPRAAKDEFDFSAASVNSPIDDRNSVRGAAGAR